jgi:S1-C subfamily serine protease
MRRAALAVMVIALGSLGNSALSAQGGQGALYDLTRTYETVNPSIVKVHADAGAGSGFLVREDGLIATNHHVVRNARYVAVELTDNRKVTAQTGRDAVVPHSRC